jgi:hypothetical protein
MERDAAGPHLIFLQFIGGCDGNAAFAAMAQSQARPAALGSKRRSPLTEHPGDTCCDGGG